MDTGFVTRLSLVVTLIAAIYFSTGLTLYAEPDKPTDPCKAFKELAKYIEKAGLLYVATGNDDEMNHLVDTFDEYSELILDLEPPDKGKC